MRQIDSMSSEEIDILKLKGMLPSEFRDRIKKQVQTSLPYKLGGSDDPHFQDHADHTEATADWFDGLADTYYSLRDEGRNPDGTGESYAERNL